MPELSKQFRLRVTPEEFVRNCDEIEIVELAMILQQEKYQQIINRAMNTDEANRIS